MSGSDSTLQPRSFADFEEDCQRGNVVAVTSTLFSRRLDPLDAYVRIAGSARQSFLFESVEGGEAVAKYSFLGADPYMVVRGEGNQTIIEKQGSIETRDETVPDFLRRHFTLHRLAPRDDLGPLAGGAVGYLGYGAARWFEPALNKSSRPPVIPDSTVDVACFMFCRNVVIFDRLHESITMVAVVLTDEAEGNNSNLKRLYDSAVHHIATTAALLASLNIDHTVKVSSRTPERGNDSFTPSVRSNWAPADFADGVRQIKEHILAGNCYQAVLSQRFTRETTAGAVSIYRALRRSNPAPYTFLLKLGAEAIIGASPEMLVRCRGDQLDYRPIAGTRRRGATDEEDQGLAEEMRADEKEVAEHMMLVDLGRNDLGRVAAYGSVRVEELMSVERYSKVQHLVSSLSARLAAGRDRFAALAACFPAGTVTGAPKVRAMEIINELEPDDRGVYAGAVLYADYAGNLDSCITIRTIIMKDGVASVQAGAGIVADSVPELEFEETVHKAAALLRAIEIAEEE